MTAKEMIAALERAKVEEYVEEVLEDMSEEDLYCNFRLNGDLFDFRETDNVRNFRPVEVFNIFHGAYKNQLRQIKVK